MPFDFIPILVFSRGPRVCSIIYISEYNLHANHGGILWWIDDLRVIHTNFLIMFLV